MKVISLVSGGIDSPVAAYLMLKKGIDALMVHKLQSKFKDYNIDLKLGDITSF